VSDHQIKRTRKILEKASPEDIAKLKSKEKTIGKVYNEIKKKEHQETLSAHQLPEGKYRVLYVDPPPGVLEASLLLLPRPMLWVTIQG